jgi:hypothetical protein
MSNWLGEPSEEMQQLNFTFSVPTHIVSDVRQIMYKLNRLIQVEITHKRNVASIISSILSDAIRLLEVKDNSQ